MLMHTYLIMEPQQLMEREFDAGVGQADQRNKGVTFKNCAPFTKCISRIKNKDIDTAQGIDIVVPRHNLIECSDDYSKASGSLWQYYKDETNDNFVRRQSQSKGHKE